MVAGQTLTRHAVDSGWAPNASRSLRRRSAFNQLLAGPSSRTTVFVLPSWIDMARRTRIIIQIDRRLHNTDST